jgi:hypothetical protein
VVLLRLPRQELPWISVAVEWGLWRLWTVGHGVVVGMTATASGRHQLTGTLIW